MKQFNELGLDSDILATIKKVGFQEPTEIQEKTIPLVLEGKDVIAGSATGSGKTLAFGAGIIQKITKGVGLQALILTPTRELAIQVADVLGTFSKQKKIAVGTVYGGVSFNPQFRDLEHCEIIVATPGRLLDHLERGTANLSKVKHLVLDEADRMLDMGFLDDVKKIMSQCKHEKQTLLFSATIVPEIKRIARQFMHDPINISLEKFVDPTKLSQIYYDVPGNMKFSLLVHFLKEEQTGLAMIFCNSRKSVDVVERGLRKVGLDAVGIHGGLTQSKRSSVLAKFHSNKAFILVCTDVAARGLDIPAVSHVYNYDAPNDSKQYVHRIGRTARAGKYGKVVNLLSDRDYENFQKVLWDNNIQVEKGERPKVERVDLSYQTKPKVAFYANRRGPGAYGHQPKGNDTRHYDRRLNDRRSNDREGSYRGSSNDGTHSSYRGSSRGSRRESYRGEFNDSNPAPYRGGSNRHSGGSRFSRSNSSRGTSRGSRRESSRGEFNDGNRDSHSSRGTHENHRQSSRSGPKKKPFRGRN